MVRRLLKLKYGSPVGDSGIGFHFLEMRRCGVGTGFWIGYLKFRRLGLDFGFYDESMFVGIGILS